MNLVTWFENDLTVHITPRGNCGCDCPMCMMGRHRECEFADCTWKRAVNP